MIDLTPEMYMPLVKMALIEDVADGDATTIATVSEQMQAEACFIAKQDCVCAGMPVAEAVFKYIDPTVEFCTFVQEGTFCPKGTVMAKVSGNARSLLTGERTALNFLQRLSGVATASNYYQKAVEGTNCKILDTRKTTPGYRMLEKYAVSTGGAFNHRIGLYDRIMIKDNHREMAKLSGGEDSIAWAVKSCRQLYPNLEIEVEADTLAEVAAAAEAGVEYILLDNMSNEEMAEAVKIIAGRSLTEASGGITYERIKEIAKIGVDFISVGALTHSVKSADISLDLKPIVC